MVFLQLELVHMAGPSLELESVYSFIFVLGQKGHLIMIGVDIV
jgi:hypothetical protein